MLLKQRKGINIPGSQGSLNVLSDRDKEFVKFAKNCKLAEKKMLIVLPSQNKNVILSARNLPNVKIMNASDANTYALLNNDVIVMTEKSVEIINNI